MAKSMDAKEGTAKKKPARTAKRKEEGQARQKRRNRGLARQREIALPLPTLIRAGSGGPPP